MSRESERASAARRAAGRAGNGPFKNAFIRNTVYCDSYTPLTTRALENNRAQGPRPKNPKQTPPQSLFREEGKERFGARFGETKALGRASLTGWCLSVFNAEKLLQIRVITLNIDEKGTETTVTV